MWSLILPDILFTRWEAWMFVGYTRYYVCDCISFCACVHMNRPECGWCFYSLLFVSLVCVFVQRSEDVLVASKSTILLHFLLLLFCFVCVC